MSWLNANADGIQTLLALLAGAVALIWWLMKREHNYRANIEIKLEHVDLVDGSYLYRVLIILENVGVKRIEIDRVKLFIQQVVPVPDGFQFKHADRCCEFNWPTLDGSESKLPCAQTFEPGESGPIVFDYRISARPKTVSIYVHLTNKSLLLRRLVGRDDIGWNTAQIFHLSHEQKHPTTSPAA